MARKRSKSTVSSRKTRQRKPVAAPPTIPVLGRLYAAFSRLSLTAKIGAGGLTLFGGYAAWISIQPQVHIELADAEFRERLPTFIISNSGYIAARNVTWDCDGRANVYVGGIPEAQRRYHWDRPTDDVAYSPIGLLKPGERVVRRCRELAIPAGANLSPGTVIAPIVQYDAPFWPLRWTEVSIFGLEGDERMNWYWEYQGQPLEEGDLEDLKDQGYDINRLSRL